MAVSTVCSLYILLVTAGGVYAFGHPYDLDSSTCRQAGFFRHPRDCARFYRCVRQARSAQFSVFHFQCPLGTLFDERVQVCNYPWKSPPCVISDNVASGSTPDPARPVLPGDAVGDSGGIVVVSPGDSAVPVVPPVPSLPIDHPASSPGAIPPTVVIPPVSFPVDMPQVSFPTDPFIPAETPLLPFPDADRDPGGPVHYPPDADVPGQSPPDVSVPVDPVGPPQWPLVPVPVYPQQSADNDDGSHVENIDGDQEPEETFPSGGIPFAPPAGYPDYGDDYDPSLGYPDMLFPELNPFPAGTPGGVPEGSPGTLIPVRPNDPAFLPDDDVAPSGVDVGAPGEPPMGSQVLHPPSSDGGQSSTGTAGSLEDDAGGVGSGEATPQEELDMPFELDPGIPEGSQENQNGGFFGIGQVTLGGADAGHDISPDGGRPSGLQPLVPVGEPSGDEASHSDGNRPPGSGADSSLGDSPANPSLDDQESSKGDDSDVVQHQESEDGNYVSLPQSLFDCPSPGFYPFEDNCHEFYVCQEVLPGQLLADQLYRCPNRYLFDEDTRRCQREEKVNCRKFSLSVSSYSKQGVLVVLERYIEAFFATPLTYAENRRRFRY